MGSKTESFIYYPFLYASIEVMENTQKMKLDDCKTKIPYQYRDVVISMRITEGMKTWIKNEKLSITAIFHQACKELGYNTQEQQQEKETTENKNGTSQ